MNSWFNEELVSFYAFQIQIPSLVKINNEQIFNFDGDESSKEITIPSGFTQIAKCAFCHCSLLQSITIPESVIKKGKYVFFRLLITYRY